MKKRLLLFTFFLIIFTFLFSINVKIYAYHEANINEMNEYFNPNNFCKSSSDECKNEPEYKFYQKMYDLYYLYLSKYNVKLDLPLIMSTLTFYSDDMQTIFKMNLSDYERQVIVLSDWNPTDITSLDWDYDYESKDNYLVNNDSSMDMQILAKNMVTRTIVEKCMKDGKVMNTKTVKDLEEDLTCEDGETLEKDPPTYTLNLEKYDEFLLEYIEKKYYLNRMVSNPVRSNGPSYNSNKKPSVISRRRSTSSSSNGNNSSNNGTTQNNGNNDVSDNENSTKVNVEGGFKNKLFYYNQYDFSNSSYGVYGTIASHGCGPSSLAIVISSILQEEHSPIELTNYMCERGRCTNNGAVWSDIPITESEYAQEYGFKTAQIGDLDELRNVLSSGNALAVTITNGGFYTNSGNKISSGGHYFVLTGVADDGSVTIADPANTNNTGRTVNLENLASHNHNSISNPSFWVVYK